MAVQHGGELCEVLGFFYQSIPDVVVLAGLESRVLVVVGESSDHSDREVRRETARGVRAGGAGGCFRAGWAWRRWNTPRSR